MERKEGTEEGEGMSEGVWMFDKKTAKMIYRLMANLQIQPLHVKVTNAYVREGWREKKLANMERQNPTG